MSRSRRKVVIFSNLTPVPEEIMKQDLSAMDFDDLYEESFTLPGKDEDAPVVLSSTRSIADRLYAQRNYAQENSFLLYDKDSEYNDDNADRYTASYKAVETAERLFERRQQAQTKKHEQAKKDEQSDDLIPGLNNSRI